MNHFSSVSMVIINTFSRGDFWSVIDRAVMTDVHCIICHRLWLMYMNIPSFLFTMAAIKTSDINRNC